MIYYECSYINKFNNFNTKLNYQFKTWKTKHCLHLLWFLLVWLHKNICAQTRNICTIIFLYNEAPLGQNLMASWPKFNVEFVLMLKMGKILSAKVWWLATTCILSKGEMFMSRSWVGALMDIILMKTTSMWNEWKVVYCIAWAWNYNAISYKRFCHQVMKVWMCIICHDFSYLETWASNN